MAIYSSWLNREARFGQKKMFLLLGKMPLSLISLIATEAHSRVG